MQGPRFLDGDPDVQANEVRGCTFTLGSPQAHPRLTPGSPQAHPRLTPGSPQAHPRLTSG
jgi:hypothetical protein